MDKIRFIEALAANAWQPEIEEPLDGWQMRYTQGITRRGNSVYPFDDEENLPLEEKLSVVEETYARWGEPPCFQMTQAAQPPGLVNALADRGYQDRFHTQVQTALIKDVLAKTSSRPEFDTIVEDKISEAWLIIYTQTSGYDEHSTAMRRGILSRIRPRAGFLLLSIDGYPAAVGLGVLERGWVGVYCMVTREEHRRKGAAVQILYTLAQWGERYNAENIYLQVMENNPNALTLYAKAGFEKLYQYWYSQK